MIKLWNLLNLFKSKTTSYSSEMVLFCIKMEGLDDLTFEIPFTCDFLILVQANTSDNLLLLSVYLRLNTKGFSKISISFSCYPCLLCA